MQCTVLCILMLVGVFTSSQATGLDRVNYGVYLRVFRSFKYEEGFWAHSFHFELPKFQHAIPAYNLAEWNSMEYFKMDSKYVIRNISYTDIFQFLEKTYNETNHNLEVTFNAIQDLLPNVNVSDIEGRSRRSLLPFVGSIFSTLFGGVHAR